MGCNEWSCGTSLGEITLPNDPSNNSALSAIGMRGGIQLSWSYPTVNPQAVAFFRIYRGTSTDPYASIELATSSTSYYFDTLEEGDTTRYYYWIQVVSINGTAMEYIGPADAVALSAIASLIESLTGKIDSGVLSSALRAEIGRITSLESLLAIETENRTFRDAVVAEALTSLQDANGQAMTAIAQEVLNRTTETEALVDSVNFIAAGLDTATAAFLEEQQIRATTDSALSTQISQTEASLGNQVAAVQNVMSAEIASINGEITTLGALWTAKVTVNNLIGGFGVYNNGQTVEAGFDVDTFWVGRTTTDKTKPFIISNGVVYIKQAMIANASIDTLRIAGNAVMVPSSEIYVGECETGAVFYNTFTVSGLNSGEVVPVHFHIGLVAAEFTGFFTVAFNSTMLASDVIDGGSRSYLGLASMVGNGTHQLRINFTNWPKQNTRISLMTQVCKR